MSLITSAATTAHCVGWTSQPLRGYSAGAAGVKHTMSRLSEITLAAILSSGITAIAVYFVVSHFMMAAWKDEANYLLGFVEVEGVRDSMNAELQVLRALSIEDSVRNGEDEDLLSLACTSLALSLPSIKPALYKDAPNRKAEIDQVVQDGRALLEKLRSDNVCLTRP